ncbi:Cysteine desulfurase [Poriferisphaera corsica]|uniref:cysteine desulfurase n=1 Tax=Poriferisphaera corsica TaxID=2528020 RepID=A0A517YUR3_9BACT|nr:aminotransferase class V-fold PLP-dependent enzyme [Poriferisphaera corsica]QDU33968.1 Cysteine desulfurase [Poriferisphaera corsica]
MSKRIYMDNAATSFPKPSAVMEAMTDYATRLGASPGRGAYAEARESGELMYQCRERICELIGGDNPDHVVFTLNTSDAINLGIRGLIHPGAKKRHVITTWLDHNSILRPFNMMSEMGDLEQTRVECDPMTGLVDPDDIKKAIRPDTGLIALLHGSNVSGTVQPIREIGAIAKEHGVPFLVDAAQSLGHMPLDIEADHVDLLAFPGHKGLLGPLGTGGLYIKPGLERLMRTVKEGGTGSVSELDVQPEFMPDRFEPGSHNAIGIIGLSEGVKWILDQGVETIWAHEQKLMKVMVEGLQDEERMPNLTWYGPQGVADRCGVFSIRIQGYDQPVTLSDVLEKRYGILTRSGIHCAPLAHKTIGTHELGGTTRFSFGPFVTVEDVRASLDAIHEICLETKKRGTISAGT